MCERLNEWFTGGYYRSSERSPFGDLIFKYDQHPGIYSLLTGHEYFMQDMSQDQKTYIGQYPVLHDLYRKIIDFKESFVSGVNQQTLGQRKQIIRQKAEELRRASRQVLEFFNNNH